MFIEIDVLDSTSPRQGDSLALTRRNFCYKTLGYKHFVPVARGIGYANPSSVLFRPNAIHSSALSPESAPTET